MTRIIAGAWGGRRLAVPPRGTRPTTDRVREAVFSRLDHGDHLRGARVLDLFAGSGALGLEAVSRGAAHATLVEADARAVSVLRGNVRDLGGAASATVVKERVRPFLSRPGDAFDVILLDPPYDIPREDLTAVLESAAQRLAPDGVMVLEWSTRAGEAPWPRTLEGVASKAYGETAIHYAMRLDPDPDGGSVEA
ncbi:16S rRNA (guanine(966)-N(2))-methyltransferase RsmD [Demequina mangrovi]|uniref:16S rRNA (Guanine966-N2)-methyltransferase n=1 Tax=Demequina mangrovi TaxID=1043493 RepID=A0A1H6V9N2_9MICO|nr:16S rRNA (guanine(966)-N(2))-methyltransferase RsmD [Demequina mangrovi]SEI99624.1 16S rRNA (guanine966-N2)-methyltransferase [Demequina mangrovi]